MGEKSEERSTTNEALAHDFRIMKIYKTKKK